MYSLKVASTKTLFQKSHKSMTKNFSVETILI